MLSARLAMSDLSNKSLVKVIFLQITLRIEIGPL